MTQKMDAKITKLTVFQFNIRDIEIEVIYLGTSIMDKCRYMCIIVTCIRIKTICIILIYASESRIEEHKY